MSTLFLFYSTEPDLPVKSGGYRRMIKLLKYIQAKGFSILKIEGMKARMVRNRLLLSFLFIISIFYTVFKLIYVLKFCKKYQKIVIIPITHFAYDVIIGILLKTFLKIIKGKKAYLIIYEQHPISYFRKLLKKRSLIDTIMIINEKIGMFFAKYFADIIFVLSKFDIKWFNLDIKKVYITTNGFSKDDLKDIINIYQHLRAKGTIIKDIDFVYIARITEEKGALDLIPIIKYLDKKLTRPANFYIIGDGPLLPKIKLFLETFKPKMLKVKILGYVSNSMKLKVIARSKILIYPSYADSFSYVILEAITFGTYVVTYKLFTLWEKWRNSGKVIFVPIGAYEKLCDITLNLIDEHLNIVVTLPDQTQEEIFERELAFIFNRLLL